MALKNKVAISGAALAIISAIFLVEGGYVNDKDDPGGETNHGITKQVAVDNGYTGSMKDLPKEFAQEIYYNDYVVKPGFLPLVSLSPAVAHKVIDAGVNTGTTRPSKWLQQSLNNLNRNGQDYPTLSVDGRIGIASINAYKALQNKRGKVKACELTIKMLDAYQASYYASLTNLSTYTVGWIDKRIHNVPLSQCKQ